MITSKGNGMKIRNWRIFWTQLFLTIILITGCVDFPVFTQTPQSTPIPLPTPVPILKAEVVFQVDVPKETPEKQGVFIDLLDEITGLAINPMRYPLEQIDQNRYATRISIPMGSLIKYRYGRDANPTINEFTPNGKQVRYRLLKVAGPMIAEDIVSAWTDQPFRGQFGRISGKIVDAKTNQPVPNIMVAAGGVHTFTSSTGNYLIEGLPQGTHRIVAYSLDGAYQLYQQGARVAIDSDTPASFKINSAQLVNATFHVKVPQSSVRGIPIHLVGDLYALGNTYADLGGGLSTISARAPLMTLLPDGSYTLSMQLPAGLDLRYKYSLGDGFWNSEHTQNGSFLVRQLIVPEKDIEINDTIDTWQAPVTAPVSFTVKVPANTPVTDTISIQFNPYGWTEPIPMWPLGNNQWMYVLYGPFSASSVGYRYCRNDQCGVADDDATKGMDSQGLIFTPSRLTQNLQDEVKKWAWWQSTTSPTTVVAPQINPRGPGFIAGIEISPKYSPVLQSKWNLAFQNVKDLHANWLVLTPTWSYTRTNPPVLEVLPGKDPLWQDLVQTAGWSQEKGFNLAIFPTTNFPDSKWWYSTSRDAGWWQSWFDRYEAFLIHNADLATKSTASILILGDPGNAPAFSGYLPNGDLAKAPSDLIARWKKIIANVRAHFTGKIYWTIPFSQSIKELPGIIEDLDGIYVLWSAPLNVSPTATEADLLVEFTRYMDQDLIKIKEKTKKALVIGVNFTSFDGAAKGCVPSGATCQTMDSLHQPTQDIPALQVDSSEQANLYNAFLSVVNQKNWIDGVVSRGYYPPVAVLDKSSSINGKPASDVLWYWFPKLLAKP